MSDPSTAGVPGGPSRARYVLIATDDAARGRALRRVASDLGRAAEVFDEVEAVLYHTRAAVPEAMIVEAGLVDRVPQLDVLALLRRRAALAEVPLVVLGPPESEREIRAIDAGADAYLPRDARPVVVRAYLARLLDRRGRDAQLRAALERARAVEQAYRDSERVKDDLTHMLVHDLKSPIASVMGLLDHSIETMAAEGGDATVSELLALARHEAQHLLALATNILDVRRMTEGHMPYAPEPIDSLGDLAREALRDVAAGPRERRFDVLVRPEAERLEADPKLLRRILANLFANAIRHTRRDGHVDFRAWRDEDAFVLSVRDDGEGIPEADHGRIFNAFEQSRHTIHDRFDTGMGLTFCKLAVEKHGGRIWVDSQVGKGSTFSFTIPVDVAARSDEDAVTVV